MIYMFWGKIKVALNIDVKSYYGGEYGIRTRDLLTASQTR